MSEGQKKIFSKFKFESKESYIIQNSISDTDIEINDKTKSISKANKKSELILGYLGRGTVEKGYFFLVDEILSIRNLKFCIKIGGNVTEKMNIEQACYLGHVEKNTFLDSIDVLIVPSLWSEPFGRVVIEALCKNKIVVCSNVGGVSDFGKYSNVIMFTPKPGELSKILKEIIENGIPDNSSKQAFNYKDFNSESITSQYLRVYNSIISNPD
ncbi:glycosyltransferase [Emticicia sp. ODNR4P]|nr:glycosyltransferase [Emticicia sp. ODNR4P]